MLKDLFTIYKPIGSAVHKTVHFQYSKNRISIFRYLSTIYRYTATAYLKCVHSLLRHDGLEDRQTSKPQN